MNKNATNLVLGATLCLGLVTEAAGGEFFVSPSGLPSGDGSRLRPWSLTTALADNTKAQNVNNAVKPGDTIWLLGGTYNTYALTWPYTLPCKLVGTSNSPIVLRQYPGERAVIDGGIYCGNPSDWVTFWGFEITCSRPRTNTYDQRPAGLVLSAKGHKAINLVVHDSGHPGIGGGGGEVYGCILWGTGIYEYDYIDHYPTNPWTRGSALYLQNSSGNYLVSDNISRGNLNAGMKAYAENGQVQGFIFDGNVSFLNNGEGIEVECLNNSITNATVRNNFTYRCLKNPMGYFTDRTGGSLASHNSLVYSNNYDYGSPGPGTALLWLKRWTNITVLNNTIVTTSQTNEWVAGSGVGLGSGGKFIQLEPQTNVVLNYTINRNAYFGGVEQGGSWYDAGIFNKTYVPFYNVQAMPYDGTNGVLSFAYWTNKLGYDRNSTYTTNLPTANVVVLRPNKYEPGRGNLVVFNWASNNTLNVNISSLGLSPGQRFEVRDVQDYLGMPVLTTNYNPATPTIVIPLTNTNVSKVTGGIEGNYTFNPNVHTASLFNTFVILPLGSQAGLRPPSALRILP